MPITFNKEGFCTCAICQCNSLTSARALSTHIGKKHSIDARTYYDKYVKIAGEGTCKVCGNPTKFRSISEGYKECCSHACFGKLLSTDKEKLAHREAKREATCMAKYGVKNGGGTREALEKAQQTNMERRGVKWNMQSKAVIEKSKQTCLEKYGTTTYVHSQEGASRVTDTVRERFGRDNFFSGADGLAAARKGLMDKRGIDNPMHSKDIIEARSSVERNKYDGKLFVQTEEFKRKSFNTQIERYGAWHSASVDAKQVYMKKYDTMISPYGCHIVGMTDKEHIEYTCTVCDNRMTENANFIKFRVTHGLTPCPNCYNKSMPTSVEEQEVSRFVESLGFTVNHYDRDFLGTSGADIVIEDRKVIIEYDGLYWHTEQYRPDRYHLTKMHLAEDKGYRLIHLFGDEWCYKDKIVRSRIADILGKWDYAGGVRVGARKCIADEVDTETAKKFLEDNHLQGAIQSKWRYGLYKDGELVALMTFGQNRFSDGIELHRFCNKIGVHVVGGASKLFKHFIGAHPEVDCITTFADARWSRKNAFYINLGFEFDSLSAPGYYIVDGDIRRNRLQFQRHKIAGPGDEGKTEHDITRERGLYRIYDCGQYKYVWYRNSIHPTKEANCHP